MRIGLSLKRLASIAAWSGVLPENSSSRANSTMRIAFFAATMVNLSGQSEKRVRSILADGRRQAICALFETAGLGSDISALFAEAVLLWRKDARDGGGRMTVTARLAMRTREARGAASAALLEMIEGLAIAEQRQSARSFALLAAQDAA